MRFSYVVHKSEVSAGAYKEFKEYALMEEGVFRRRDGACCDSWRATAGGRCAGGCSNDELMVTCPWISA